MLGKGQCSGTSPSRAHKEIDKKREIGTQRDEIGESEMQKEKKRTRKIR